MFLTRLRETLQHYKLQLLQSNKFADARRLITCNLYKNSIFRFNAGAHEILTNSTEPMKEPVRNITSLFAQYYF